MSAVSYGCYALDKTGNFPVRHGVTSGEPPNAPKRLPLCISCWPVRPDLNPAFGRKRGTPASSIVETLSVIDLIALVIVAVFVWIGSGFERRPAI